jgi:hypothetical protein
VPRPFAYSAKGWEAQTWFCNFRIQSLNIRDRCSHPCKERKDGAPSVVVVSDQKGRATRRPTI